jgi:predicted protein tyrosine phosphatase
MRWKFSLPSVGAGRGDDRIALEDLYLVPEDGSSGGQSYWITVEGLQSFTGGTREEKLERLGGKEFHISDTMDMLVHQDDFSRSELLGWARVFIQNRFGDPHPELVEADGDEVSRCTPVIHENDPRAHAGRSARLLFVHHQAGPPVALPEETLNGDARLQIVTLCLDDVAVSDIPLDHCLHADLVFVMEKRTRQLLQKRFKSLGVTRRIICLYLPEHHDGHDPAFVALFRERVGVYLDRFGWNRNERD